MIVLSREGEISFKWEKIFYKEDVYLFIKFFINSISDVILIEEN